MPVTLQLACSGLAVQYVLQMNATRRSTLDLASVLGIWSSNNPRKRNKCPPGALHSVVAVPLRCAHLNPVEGHDINLGGLERRLAIPFGPRSFAQTARNPDESTADTASTKDPGPRKHRYLGHCRPRLARMTSATSVGLTHLRPGRGRAHKLGDEG